jgi:hypothetical protein
MKAYKKRMVKEYKQLHKRAKKLQKILIKYEAGTLEFSPDTPIYVLQEQLRAMNEYCHALRLRAEFEGIDLEY